MKNNKAKINIIDPIFFHNVYEWWCSLFSSNFDFSLYSLSNNKWNLWKFFKLESKKSFHLKSNTFVFFKKPNVNTSNYNILWDIFMNNLCFHPSFLSSKNSIFYSEYYMDWKWFIKNFLFYTLGKLFFRNKKVIVPHKLWINSFKKITNKVFYLPQLYSWDVINKPIIRDDNRIKFLFAGRISQYYKNVEFLIKNFQRLKRDECELYFVWKIFDLKEEFRTLLDNSKYNIKYLWEKTFDELTEIYKNCDVLVLPSKSEPIGSVVMEAMANGCIPIVSDFVWGGGYLNNWNSWFLFKSDDDEDFTRILNYCADNKDLLYKMRCNAVELVKNQYWIKNPDVINMYTNQLKIFLKE